jgi:GH25 family lysozyme M1 (1,4-beta-N-acetylmuramidase)
VTAPPQWSPGSPEAAEHAAISHAPAWHARPLARRRIALARPRPPAVEPDPDVLSDHAFALLQLASLTTGGTLFGPDVSQYQGKPNWATVAAAGCRIKFWKATEGRTFLDPSAAYNQTHTAGMLEGCYHFLYYSQEYADKPSLWGAQADWYAKNAPATVGHFLDVEAAATAGHWLGVKEWVAEYRRLFPGHPLGGYFNRSLWANRSRVPYDPRDLFDYIWHAGIGDGYYTSATGSIQAEWAAISKLVNSVANVGYPDVRLWQITDHGSVPGVSGTCDGNAYQGSIADLAATLTGKKDDSMSAAEVQEIKDYIDAKVPTLAGVGVHRQRLFAENRPDGRPLTFGDALLGTFDTRHDLAAVKDLVDTAIAEHAPTGGGGGISAADLQAAVTAGVAQALDHLRVIVQPADAPMKAAPAGGFNDELVEGGE